MMKRLFALILAFAVVLGLTACGRAEADDLMLNISAKAVDVQPDMETGASAAADFGVRLFQASLEEGKNTLISPLSVLYALAMTANGADSDTLEQMEAVLGMDCENLNSFMLAYMDLLPEAKDNKLNLANSIWFKDDPAFSVEESFLQTNADYYGAGIYKAAFDAGTRHDINNWVEQHTDGMIPEIIDEIPEEAIMYLVNALAFEAQWEEVYEEFQIQEGHFTTEDGTRQNVDLMHSEESAWLEDDKATGFIKYYKDRRYAFAALLPNEGISVAEYVESLTGDGLLDLLSNPEDTTVFASIPRFETEYDTQMSEVLREMGMPDAFDQQKANFSRLGVHNGDGVNIYINRVLHKTCISVAEQGTRAGATTTVEIVADGAIFMEEIKEVVLDRPFVYMLIDCETNLPFFIGTMMDTEGN